jgi:hypothetical protein
MRFGVVVVLVVVAVGAAVGIAWGWFAVSVYAAVLAVSALLGTVLAVFNRSGGGLARDAGRLTYDRWMGDRR